MSSRRQKLLARVNWYLPSSLNTLLTKSRVIHFIREVVVTDRFHCIQTISLYKLHWGISVVPHKYILTNTAMLSMTNLIDYPYGFILSSLVLVLALFCAIMVVLYNNFHQCGLNGACTIARDSSEGSQLNKKYNETQIRIHISEYVC